METVGKLLFSNFCLSPLAVDNCYNYVLEIRN